MLLFQLVLPMGFGYNIEINVFQLVAKSLVILLFRIDRVKTFVLFKKQRFKPADSYSCGLFVY